MKRIVVKWLIFSFLFAAIQQNSFGQAKITANSLLTADSLASETHKEILNDFFNLALENLIGPEKQVKFTSNLFAIMLKHNPNLMVDTNYKKYTAARNLNMHIAAGLDSNNKFG